MEYTLTQRIKFELDNIEYNGFLPLIFDDTKHAAMINYGRAHDIIVSSDFSDIISAVRTHIGDISNLTLYVPDYVDTAQITPFTGLCNVVTVPYNDRAVFSINDEYDTAISTATYQGHINTLGLNLFGNDYDSSTYVNGLPLLDVKNYSGNIAIYLNVLFPSNVIIDEQIDTGVTIPNDPPGYVIYASISGGIITWHFATSGSGGGAVTHLLSYFDGKYINPELSISLSNGEPLQGETITATVNIINHPVENNVPVYIRVPRDTINVTDADDSFSDQEYSYYVKHVDFITSTASVNFSCFVTENSEDAQRIDIYAGLDPTAEFTVFATAVIGGSLIAETEIGGGNGTFHEIHDPIPGAQDIGSFLQSGSCGLYTVYKVPAYADLEVLGNAIWDTSFWDNLTGKNVSMLDAIISLSILPYTPEVSGNYVVHIGGQMIEYGEAQSLVMPVVSKLTNIIDCGTVEIQQYYDAFFDYAPNCDIRIYLPFIGERALDPDLVTGKTLGLKYYFNNITGDCVAVISVDGQDWFYYQGNGIVNIPMTGSDRSRAANGMLGIMQGGLVTGLGIATGNPFMASQGLGSITGNAIESMQASKPMRAGSFSGFNSLMGCRVPYIIKTYANAAVANRETELIGGMMRRGGLLSDCSGFTKVIEVHLDNFTATQAEKDLIEKYLKEGVII